MSFQELVNALQAVEQRQAYRQEGTSENALVVVYKGKNHTQNFPRNNQSGKMEKERDWRPNNQQSSNWQHNLIRKEKKEFSACKYCQQTNHFEEWCRYKNVQC